MTALIAALWRVMLPMSVAAVSATRSPTPPGHRFDVDLPTAQLPHPGGNHSYALAGIPLAPAIALAL